MGMLVLGSYMGGGGDADCVADSGVDGSIPAAMMGAQDQPMVETKHADGGIPEHCDRSAEVQFTDGSQTEGLALLQVEGQLGQQ